MSATLHTVRIIFDDGTDVAIEHFNTHSEAVEYQIQEAKKHQENDCIRDVYVTKTNQDEFTHRVVHNEWKSTYFMGTGLECDLYRLDHDPIGSELFVEEVTDSE